MSRILSWKSPKEGPSAFGSDILAFQPTAMEASRRQRDERTAARRAAYKAKVARREAQMGLPKRPNVGANPLVQKEKERAVALRQGEALARSINQGRPRTAAPRVRSWETHAEAPPPVQDQIAEINDRNAMLKAELSKAAQQWERKPRNLGPQPKAFAKPRPKLWQRPSSAPVAPPSDLDDGMIRHDFGEDLDPEDLPDLAAVNAECVEHALSVMGLPSADPDALKRAIKLSLPDAFEALTTEAQRATRSAEDFSKSFLERSEQLVGGVAPEASALDTSVVDRGPITSLLVRQPSTEKFLQIAAVEADAQRELAKLQSELEHPGLDPPAPQASPQRAARPERPHSASYVEGESVKGRTRRSPASLEYLQSVNAEDSRYGAPSAEMTEIDPSFYELSDAALGGDPSIPDFGERFDLSAIKSVDPGATRRGMERTTSNAELAAPLAEESSASGIGDGLSALSVGPDGLAVLRIREYGMRDAMAISVAASVGGDRSNGASLLLDLAHNLIGDDGALALASAIERNGRATALDLSYNFVKRAGAVALGRCLPHTKLRRLGLSHNPLGSLGTAALGSAIGLPGSAGLRSLKVAHVGMGAVGAVALAEGVAANKGLRLLDMSNNVLRTSGAMAIAGNVGINVARGGGAGLTALDLGWCGIDDPPVALLAEGLVAGCSLRRLDLSHNQVSTTGAEHLARMLKVHIGLQLLILDHNPAIAFEGCKKFVSLQLDNIINEVVFEPREEGDEKVAGDRVVHVSQCSAEQLPAVSSHAISFACGAWIHS